MKSNTFELHNYADLEIKDNTRKRKANNASGEKYSLRQKRQKKNEVGTMEKQSEIPEFDMEEEMPERTVKAKKNTSTNKSKTKAKAPPLSKYRRKTANARERSRMKEINQAFETLRHCVPQAITGEDPTNANEKLTKITTLRLAMKYINMLKESLEDPSYDNEFIVECLEESAKREMEPIRIEAEEFVEEHLKQLPSQPPQQQKKKTTKAKTGGASKKTSSSSAANKRPSKASKAKKAVKSPELKTTAGSSTESCYASSSIGSPPFTSSSLSSPHTTAACSPSSAYASLSSSASTHSELEPDSLLGSLQALGDLNTLLDDGESLSHQCFSPDYPSLMSALPSRGDMTMSSHVLDKPDVELSLHLLDQSTSDSFDFSNGNQQPSACISPLATLADTFHPFGDLLHGDLSDMFLT